MIHHGELPMRFLLIAQVALSFFSVSCVAKSTSTVVQSNSYVAQKVAQSPSPPQSAKSPEPPASPGLPSPQQNPIREVDFKNFTYPWYPSYLTPSLDSRQVTLRDGKFEVERDEKRDIERLRLDLDNVSYVDLTGDNKEEAIVTLGGSVTNNSFVNGIFIYTIEKSRPRLLWQHETGDRADGGLRRIGVENRSLVIEKYARSVGDGGLCCPKKFSRTYYRWDGEQFEKEKSETLPNEYDNARFLAYPTNPA